ncbi:MAG: sulfatase [Bryobacterales bacterium]|nr:sulfatase [Bryobacterales bacterium]
MSHKQFQRTIPLAGYVCALAAMLAFLTVSCATTDGTKPNIVLIFIDDLGYGDIGPFGSTTNKTPQLDRMAAEGLALRQFYVSNTNCTPSRAALMTGTYAHRIGMDGDVLFPGERRGLNPNETTIAEVMKGAGYATGIFGKWHLGDQPEHLPLEHGFDKYFGIPYSNDMWPGNLKGHRHTKEPYTPLPVVRNDQVVAYVADGADQSLLAEAVTDAAIEFIREHRAEPFFLYLPHAYIHRPRYVRPEIAERAGGDINRAVVEEVDDSVGRVLDTLRALDLAEGTLVIFTSDNGGSTGMSMGPLRGGKGGPKYEGHMREPTLTWWPGTIPAGQTTDEIVSALDILPSLAALVGAARPDRQIDGKNALDILLGNPNARSPHELLFYEDEGIRRGNWKLVRGASGGFELYDLDADVGETNDLAAAHPERVGELRALLEDHAAEIAANQRPAAQSETALHLITEPGDLPKLRELIGVSDFEAVAERR